MASDCMPRNRRGCHNKRGTHEHPDHNAAGRTAGPDPRAGDGPANRQRPAGGTRTQGGRAHPRTGRETGRRPVPGSRRLRPRPRARRVESLFRPGTHALARRLRRGGVLQLRRRQGQRGRHVPGHPVHRLQVQRQAGAQHRGRIRTRHHRLGRPELPRRRAGLDRLRPRPRPARGPSRPVPGGGSSRAGWWRTATSSPT